MDAVRVLIVDDEPTVLETIELFLEYDFPRTCQIFKADNGKMAWDMLQVQPFDLLLTDHHMPLKDGLTLVKELRASTSPNSSIPAILLTGAIDNHETLENAAEVGINEIVGKPINPAKFKEKIIKSLKQLLT